MSDRVVVTGAGSGIGAHLVNRLAETGRAVIGLDIAVPAKAPIPILSCDITDEEQTRTAIRTAVDHLRGIDVLVNCAGVGAQGTVETSTAQDWERVFAVNVFGLARVSRLALPHLRASKAGTIVNIASVAAATGLRERAGYSGSKGAVVALTRAMAADLLQDGVSVVSISPGTVDTPWVDNLLDDSADPAAELAALRRRQPIGRLISSSEVVEAVLYAIGPNRWALTGTCLPVDGGMTTMSGLNHA